MCVYIYAKIYGKKIYYIQFSVEVFVDLKVIIINVEKMPT